MELPTTRVRHNEDNQDRLSQLPDSILHHIFHPHTFDTVELVQTCILSKRWRNLWASMVDLYFDDREWEPPHTMLATFLQFVTSVLLLRDDLDVKSFHVQWYHDFDLSAPLRLASWVQYAVKHNVKQLRIEPYLDDYFEDAGFELPACIFTCRTLEYLELNVTGCLFLQLPQIVDLSRVKGLALGGFRACSLSLKTLLSGCPLLQELDISGCELKDLDISSNSLKKINLDGNNISGSRIRISVPSSRYFDFGNNEIEGLEVLLENLSSLVGASFQTEGVGRLHFEEDQLLKFVYQQNEDEQKPSICHKFLNLEHLEFTGRSMLSSFPTVAYFLQRSPKLRRLTMILKLRLAPPSDARYLESSRLEKQLICHQRKIHITLKCGKDNDRILELLTDFLKRNCSCS